MEHYYETFTTNEIQAHETLDEAIEFATNNNCEIISEIGGNWEEYKYCWFCEEWQATTDFNIGASVCYRCEIAIRDHEGGEF